MFEKYRRVQERRQYAPADDRGFTLIELLIVIVVLGILSAVVVFALGGVTSKSAVAACTADAKSVETAVEAYRATNGTYATTTGALIATTSGGPYLRSWPSNPSHYQITIGGATGSTAGEVDVIPGNGTTGPIVNYDTETSSTGCNAVT